MSRKSNPAQLLRNIDLGEQKNPDLCEWGALRSEVIDHYPRFNSNSYWMVTCPVCHCEKEIQVYQIYRGKFTCLACHNRTKFHPAGQIVANTPESHHKGAITRIANGDNHLHTPEARAKAWSVRKSKSI